MDLITEFPLLREKTVLSKSTRLIRGREYPQNLHVGVELVTCDLSLREAGSEDLAALGRGSFVGSFLGADFRVGRRPFRAQAACLGVGCGGRVGLALVALGVGFVPCGLSLLLSCRRVGCLQWPWVRMAACALPDCGVPWVSCRPGLAGFFAAAFLGCRVWVW